MNSQSDGTSDVALETAPEKGAVEQAREPKQTSFEDTLLKLAIEEGHVEPPKAQDEPAVEEPLEHDAPADEPDETETQQTPSEGEDAEDEETEPQPAAEKDKLDKLVPLREVIEERQKKQRANERVERVEGELATIKAKLDEAQRQLSQASGPMPTEVNPLIDIQDSTTLGKLKAVYYKLKEVDLSSDGIELNEDGTVTVPAAIGRDGQIVYQNIDPKQARLAKERADRMLHEFIPAREKYLVERAQVDAGATEWYPDLKDPDHKFTQLVNQLTNQVLSGAAAGNPETKFWVANAVYGFLKRTEEQKARNGSGTPAAAVKTVVEASRRKLAPTASRTRAFSERKSGADLARSQQKFEQNPSDRDAAADYVGAILSGKNSQRTVQPPAE